VIVRTAAEGATEDELARDVTRLQAQWDDIRAKAKTVSAPALLYQEPDLVIRVVRDLFNEDFRELVIQGTDAYETVESYLSHVSPDLVSRMRRHTGVTDVFATLRIDEQITKGLDRRVFLPSGGHLVIDRTEAMTVIDVNTGKYTGAGGNLEETVTRNNLEAAEEIVRQLRLRDLGGIIVIDFIDMVLESNRDLVLRRLTECLGRDRTKHQVTEITSLGLVQMTRKRVGQGLLEAFSETCEVCKGRGLVFHSEPVADRKGNDRGPVAKVVAAAVPVAGNGAVTEAGADQGADVASAGSNGAGGSGSDSGRPSRRRGRRTAATAEQSPTGAAQAGGSVQDGRPDAAAEAGGSGAGGSESGGSESGGSDTAVNAGDETSGGSADISGSGGEQPPSGTRRRAEQGELALFSDEPSGVVVTAAERGDPTASEAGDADGTGVAEVFEEVFEDEFGPGGSRRRARRGSGSRQRTRP
jgi:ribonuclease E